MICRAPAATASCAGTSNTGAQLYYDNEGQLDGWANAPNYTSASADLYDGEGRRVEQEVATNGPTTFITYVGQVEELSDTAGITTTTTSYYAGGKRIAQAVNGVFSYLGSDGLGSAEVALDANGNAQASVLYGPYGATRYSSGTMPTDYGVQQPGVPARGAGSRPALRTSFRGPLDNGARLGYTCAYRTRRCGRHRTRERSPGVGPSGSACGTCKGTRRG
jgi:hypothetical protein